MRVRFSDHWVFGFEPDDRPDVDTVLVTVGWWSLMCHPGWFEVKRHDKRRMVSLLRTDRSGGVPGARQWSAQFHDRPGPQGLERGQRVGARTFRALVGGILRAPWVRS